MVSLLVCLFVVRLVSHYFCLSQAIKDLLRNAPAIQAEAVRERQAAAAAAEEEAARRQQVQQEQQQQQAEEEARKAEDAAREQREALAEREKEARLAATDNETYTAADLDLVDDDCILASFKAAVHPELLRRIEAEYKIEVKRNNVTKGADAMKGAAATHSSYVVIDACDGLCMTGGMDILL